MKKDKQANTKGTSNNFSGKPANWHKPDSIAPANKIQSHNRGKQGKGGK